MRLYIRYARLIFAKEKFSFRISYIALFCILPLSALSQKKSLDEVLSRIEQNNPALLSYKYKINAADELVKGAGAWMPLMTSVQWYNVPYRADYTSSQLVFGVAQTFPNSKKVQAERTYLQSLSSIEKNGGLYNKIEFFTQAKEAYYKLYISERKIKVLEESITIIKTMVSLAEKQMAITKGDLASVYRLKARQTENETMIVHERNAIRSYIATLNYLMNEDINTTFEPDTANLIKNYRSLNSYTLADSVGYTRYDIVQINNQLATLKLEQSFIALRGKPEFGLRFEHYQQLGNYPNLFSVMGTMSLPSLPWSAKGYKSQVRSMTYSINALEQNKQARVNVARQNIKMYLIELESEYTELDNYTQKVIPAYRNSLNANLIAYGQNTNDMNMALLAWDDLRMAQMEYLTHLDTYLKIQAEYEKEMQIR